MVKNVANVYLTVTTFDNNGKVAGDYCRFMI